MCLILLRISNIRRMLPVLNKQELDSEILNPVPVATDVDLFP